MSYDADPIPLEEYRITVTGEQLASWYTRLGGVSVELAPFIDRDQTFGLTIRQVMGFLLELQAQRSPTRRDQLDAFEP